MPAKSDISEKILEYLSTHPARKSRDIAEDLGVPLSTVQRHLRTLEENGKVQEGYVRTQAGNPFIHRFHIYIESDYGELKAFARPNKNHQSTIIAQIQEAIDNTPDFKGKLFLENIDILMGGDWDISIIVSAKDIQPVGEFVVNRLRSIKGIRRTKTATVWYPQDARTKDKR